MGEEVKKILVHICCAACFSYIYRILKNDNLLAVGYFYNPQVHGRTEYQKLLADVESFCKKNSLELIIPSYNIQDYFKPIMPFQDKKSIKYISDKKRWKSKRCQICNKIVMESCVSRAVKEKVDFFTTTMLATPYKDHDEISNMCYDLAVESKITFYYKDFRKGYWSGRNYAKNHDMNIPNYCGCVYSAEEGILE